MDHRFEHIHDQPMDLPVAAWSQNCDQNCDQNRVQACEPMRTDLSQDLHRLLHTLEAVRDGNFQARVEKLSDRSAGGIVSHIAAVVNEIIELNENLANELVRVRRTVGQEGQMLDRISLEKNSRSLCSESAKPAQNGWSQSANSVNSLIGDLVQPTFEIARVVTSIAKGDLSQKMALEIDGQTVKGEFLRIGMTVNALVDQATLFASEVTRVSKEVGTDGRLGGQAKVPGAWGIWRELTDNVNQLACNLTTQVRAIAEVSTAVANGDLTRTIHVEAQGEVAALSENINQMISNLKATMQKNDEQDWLKTNLAKFTNMMQGQRSITSVAQLIISELTHLLNAQHSAFYIASGKTSDSHLDVGQRANLRLIASVGVRVGRNAIDLPILFEGELQAVIELEASTPFSQNAIRFLEQLVESIGVTLNTISSAMRTENLLRELKSSNGELEAQAGELEDKARLLETKNKEVELASRSLEEKAEQLSLISKYKSEFLANMSHELRTPLNSLLILSKTLANNREQNLSAEEVTFAETVHSAGQDLLALINEILDLSKIEAGKMPIHPEDVRLDIVVAYLEQTFRPIANQKGLHFFIRLESGLPASIFSDENRLQQILKNLLSNAFKFTDHGGVQLLIGKAERHRRFGKDDVNRLGDVLTLRVIDSGIGIPSQKQAMIFEAFQQADGSTSRKYGGTGLGLTISREIARLLGGSIEVRSEVGQGSEFTLLIPQRYSGAYSSQNGVHEALLDLPHLPANADFRDRKILVVDDDMRNIFALTTILKSRGMKVAYAENGKEAIQFLLTQQDTDLILMDTMMPEMDGLEATQMIRKMPLRRHIPIISLTAKAMKGDREKCLEAGASDYVTKPVGEETLLAVMHAWLEKTDGISQ